MLTAFGPELAICIEDIAGAILANAKWEETPVDAVQIAARLGMIVAHDRAQKERGRRVQLGRTRNAATIVLGPEPRPERIQWAVAHEIGEQFARQVLEEMGESSGDSPKALREEIASGLASRLLLPRAAFGVAGEHTDWDLAALKQTFATASHELIARRMLDFASRVIVSVFDQGKLRHRWTNVRGIVPRLATIEQIAWHVAHLEQRYFDSDQEPVLRRDCQADAVWRISRVQAWPIHEAEWQREILRTVVLAPGDCGDSG